MNVLEKILMIKRTYEAEMSAIDVKDLETCTYQELKDFNSIMRKIESNPISPAIYKITERKRLEAYPILSDVRYYPELNEMTFLSREQLKSLDEALALQNDTGGNFFVLECVNSIYPDDYEKVYAFLIEKGVIEKRIFLRCDCAQGARISETFPEQLKEQWIVDFKKSNELMEVNRDSILFEYPYHGYCGWCDEEWPDLGDLREGHFDNLQFGSLYLIAKERDKQWDNV